MEWKELTPEEASQVKVSGRKAPAASNWDGLMDSIQAGKSARVALPEGTLLRNLRWGIQRAARKRGVEITVKTLEGKDGVLVQPVGAVKVTVEEPASLPEPVETPPEPVAETEEPAQEREEQDIPNEWEETKEPSRKRR